VTDASSLDNCLVPFCRAPQEFLLDRARMHGPLTLYRLDDETFASVGDPDVAHDVLHGSTADFEKGPLYDILRTMFGDGIFTAERNDWSRQHAAIAPLFARHRIRRFGETIATVTAAVLERWRRTAAGDADVLIDLKRLAFDVVAISVFSLHDEAERGALFDVMHRLDRLPIVSVSYLSRRLPLDRLGTIVDRGDSSTAAAVTLMNERLCAIADDRLSRNDQPDDVIGALLGSAVTAGLPADRRRAVLRDAIGSLLTAGYVSTGESMFWALYLLARHPDAQALARAEVMAGGVLADGQPLVDPPPYLAAALNESLRLYPPAWYIGRTTRRPLELGGVAVQAGTQVVCSPFVLHRLPALWAEPDVYRPDRFLGGPPIVPRSFIPFGSGPRACLGRGLALMEMTTLVSAALKAFDIRLSSDTPPVLAGTYSMQPREPVRFRLHPR
jgi:cytochrome P450